MLDERQMSFMHVAFRWTEDQLFNVRWTSLNVGQFGQLKHISQIVHKIPQITGAKLSNPSPGSCFCIVEILEFEFALFWALLGCSEVRVRIEFHAYGRSLVLVELSVRNKLHRFLLWFSYFHPFCFQYSERVAKTNERLLPHPNDGYSLLSEWSAVLPSLNRPIRCKGGNIRSTT